MGKYYEQVDGAAMGSPISPLVANLFSEDFEARALNTSPSPLGSFSPTIIPSTPIYSSQQGAPTNKDPSPSWTH